jgi:ABC-type branched-subunit amino acid transport system ATPase component/branched-subunit amino acid ABC-type transport system permease component
VNLLPFIVAGIATGAVYGLAGVGLVLTYKTSGIFNFAHGTVATATAFLFYTFYMQHGLPWWAAAFISLVIAGPVLGLALERLARAATGSTLAIRVVATVGLLTFIQAGVTLIYGPTYHSVRGFLGTGTFHIGSTVVSWAQVIVLGVALAATGSLYAYFRLTRGGIAMRAVVDDPALLDMAGTNPIAVRRQAWIIGATFASVSGILLAQLIGQVDPTTFTLLVVQAFAAAAVGRFTRLPATFAGGIALGIGTSLCTKYFTSGLASGLAASLPFIVLMAVLLLTPRGPFSTETFVRRTATVWRSPAWLQLSGGTVVLVFLACVPLFVGINLDAWTEFLADIILFASLGLLVRTAGEVSLCQVSFQAIGVAAFSHLAVDHHVPWLVALALAAAITLPLGVLLAIPAIRLSGLYLALVSLGFGLVLQYMFYNQSYMFRSTGFGLTIPRPGVSWLATNREYYYFVLVMVVLVALFLVVLANGRLGRLLRALAASPTGLATSGTSVNVTLVLVFCLSGSLAAISGVLGGGVVGIVSADNYPPLLSLTFFVVIMITAGREPWYALAAAAGLTVLPIYIHSGNIGNYLMLAFGFGAMAFVMVPPERRGVPEGLQRALERIGRRELTPAGIFSVGGAVSSLPRVPASVASKGVANGQTGAVTGGRPAGEGLKVLDLRVQFGGLIAVDGVSISAPVGRITGLIGPNGAGKTTVFNACSGLNQPRRGQLTIDGIQIASRGASARARLGLGRTFQQMQLFDELTVMENVAIGREGGFAGYNPVEHIWSSRRQRRVVDLATRDAVALCGLEAVAHIPAGTLSTGQRRSVELARCLAGPFRIMLLDEPSSGLDHHETRQFGDIVRRVVAERGAGVLLVEHDLELVTKICDYIYVMEFGRTLFEGTPSEVLRSPEVQAAYLGVDESSEESLNEKAPELT